MVEVLSFSFEQSFACLPCYFPNDQLKGDFSDIYVTTFFGVPTFKNTSPIRVILFLKMFNIESKLNKRKKKKKKKKMRKGFSFLRYMHLKMLQ